MNWGWLLTYKVVSVFQSFDSCKDIYRLGECVPSVQLWFIRSAFSCAEDETMYTCTIGKLVTYSALLFDSASAFMWPTA